MRRWFKGLVVRLLRVPPEPDPPAGSRASVRVFRAAENYYRYRLVKWGLKQTGALLGILFLLALNLGPVIDIPWKDLPLPERAAQRLQKIVDEIVEEQGRSESSLLGRLFFFGEMIGIVLLVAQGPFTFMMVRLDYEMRWYILTDRSLRIREGIVRLREMTMTFANVQNLSIRQGPLQRLLGISDLRVRTAGGGGGSEQGEGGEGGHESGESMHVGYFRGVGEAQMIRDEILERLKRLRGAGLGDPDDVEEAAEPDAGEGPADPTLEAAGGLLAEARALRRRVEAASGS